MDIDYCEIFTDCYHCPCPFCPYEKLSNGQRAGIAEDGDDSEDGGANGGESNG